jgi:hypothetical protein
MKMTREFTIPYRCHWTSPIIGLLIGVGMVFLAWYKSSSGVGVVPMVILAALGMWFCYGSVRTMVYGLSPILVADQSGITVYSQAGLIALGVGGKKQSLRRGQPRTIAWKDVTAIAEGTMYYTVHLFGRPPSVSSAPALLVACSATISLDNFGIGERTAIGHSAGSKEEGREWPGSLIEGHENDSHFAVNVSLLPEGLATAIRLLNEMRIRFTR